MGVWGTGLFSDDVACDIRDHYRQLLEDGAEDGAATQSTLEKFAPCFEDSDGIALIAFAVTQSKLGRLEPDVRDRAVAIIDAGADLTVWERENPKLLPKRRAVLDKARTQLTGPQPRRRRLRPPKRRTLRPCRWRRSCSRASTASGPVARGAGARSSPWRKPVLEELDFDGTEVPTRDTLEGLGPRVKDPITFMHPLASDTRFTAFVNQNVDWQQAGFQKVQTIGARPSDEQAALPSSGISWKELAERYRRRAAP